MILVNNKEETKEYILRKAFEYTRGSHEFCWFYEDYTKVLNKLKEID